MCGGLSGYGTLSSIPPYDSELGATDRRSDDGTETPRLDLIGWRYESMPCWVANHAELRGHSCTVLTLTYTALSDTNFAVKMESPCFLTSTTQIFGPFEHSRIHAFTHSNPALSVSFHPRITTLRLTRTLVTQSDKEGP